MWKNSLGTRLDRLGKSPSAQRLLSVHVCFLVHAFFKDNILHVYARYIIPGRLKNVSTAATSAKLDSLDYLIEFLPLYYRITTVYIHYVKLLAQYVVHEVVTSRTAERAEGAREMLSRARSAQKIN